MEIKERLTGKAIADAYEKTGMIPISGLQRTEDGSRGCALGAYYTNKFTESGKLSNNMLTYLDNAVSRAVGTHESMDYIAGIAQGFNFCVDNRKIPYQGDILGIIKNSLGNDNDETRLGISDASEAYSLLIKRGIISVPENIPDFADLEVLEEEAIIT